MSDNPTANTANRDDDARQAFAYVATHALDSVVHRLVGSLGNLRQTTNEHPLSVEQTELLGLADIASRQLMRLCNDMAIVLDAASQNLKVSPTLVALSTLTREAIAQAQARERSQADRVITRRLSQKLPTLWCDPALTRRALAALIENALRFSSPDTPIEVRTRKRNGWAIILVHDLGVGIAPALAETIFAPLTIGERRRNNVGEGMGVGMGLAVARACVEAQGGRLTLEPTSGPGATFSITLPMTPGHDEE